MITRFALKATETPQPLVHFALYVLFWVNPVTVKFPTEFVLPVLRSAFVHCQFTVPIQFAALRTTGSVDPSQNVVFEAVITGVEGMLDEP